MATDPFKQYGGRSAYVASQNKRYEQAFQSNNTDLMNRLQADSQRVGYELKPMSANSAGTPTTTRTVSAPPAPVNTPQPTYNDQIHDIISQMRERLNQPSTPFVYDSNADQALQAASANLQRQAQSATGDALVSLGSRGIGNSASAVRDANAIQQNTVSRINNELIPQYRDLAYQKYLNQQQQQQQQLNNMGSFLNAVTGLDQRDYERNIYADETAYNRQRQQGLDQFNQNVTQAELTGQYIDPQRQAMYNQMQANSAQWQAASQEERQRLHSENLRYAEQLGMTYDPGTGTYTQPNLSVPTMAYQQFEYGQQQDQLAQQNLLEEKAYRRQRDSEEDRQWWANYERAGQQFAQQMGYNWAQLGQREREHLADQAYKQQRLALDTRQEDRLSSQSQGIRMGASDYKTSPGFADDYQYVLNNPDKAKRDLQQNAAQFIQTYGMDGYLSLMKGLPEEDQKELTWRVQTGG